MTGIYNLSIAFYLLIIRIAAPFNKKASLWLQGRKNIFSILKEKFKGNTTPVAWFHAASLGEFEQARPVIEAFRKEYPGYRILLTFFSPSGYEIRKNYSGADDIFYLPADTRKNARQFISITNPSIVFFVKYEFWFHYLDELKKQQIHTVLFSAIFRKEQPFFSKYTDFYKNILYCFSWLFVQDKISLSLLNSIAVQNASAVGDTRFDRVKDLVQAKKEISIAEAFKNNQKVFIIGSAWNADMEVLIPFINEKEFSNLKFIIAPHEIHPEEIQRWKQKIKHKTSLYSEASEQTITSQEVLIIDNIGLLSSLYQYAEYAWIGGAYGKGLHNILEAATYGMPVFFGTHYQKFKEAKDLIEEGAAFSVKNMDEFKKKFLPIWNDEALRKSLAATASSYVQKNTGATEAILQYLSTHFKSPTSKS
ncbi:MAG TPA: glycosyltransferase N-terminal domain-containing protein [Cytophagaceae bacterium]|nr:glycosyltransferase N-terminal domain-containing protein [Cytophagaceae bacterium]